MPIGADWIVVRTAIKTWSKGSSYRDGSSGTTRLMTDPSIAERQLADERRATEQLRLALEAVPTGMLMLDAAGTIVLVNAQIESLFGFPRRELLGQMVDMLVPERFRARHSGYRARFFAAPRMRPMGTGLELFGLRKDGSEIPVEIGLNHLHTADGAFVICSIVDLSRQREVERVRSEFISTVSHELRTPLTSISGALGILQSGAAGALPEKANAMARMAYRNSERLVRIINDILDIGKLEAGKVGFQCSHVPLAELLRQSIEANAAYADKYGVRFELDDASSGELAFVDPNRVIQVLTNLLSNAVKFSPRGTAVRIRAYPHGAMLRVEIADSGLVFRRNSRAAFSRCSPRLMPRRPAASRAPGWASALPENSSKAWADSSVSSP